MGLAWASQCSFNFDQMAGVVQVYIGKKPARDSSTGRLEMTNTRVPYPSQGLDIYLVVHKPSFLDH